MFTLKYVGEDISISSLLPGPPHCTYGISGGPYWPGTGVILPATASNF